MISGDPDVLLPVIVPDLKADEIFHTTILLQLPGGPDIRSTFAIQVIKEPSSLPIGHLPDTRTEE